MNFIFIFFLFVSISPDSLEAGEISFRLNNVLNSTSFDLEVSIENDLCKSIKMPLVFIPEDYYVKFYIENQEGISPNFVGHEIDFIESDNDFLMMHPRSKYSQKINLSDYYRLDDECYKVIAKYTVLEGSRKEKNMWFGELISNELKLNCD